MLMASEPSNYMYIEYLDTNNPCEWAMCEKESFIVNKVEKLIPNLNNKEKDVIHHCNLKLYVDLGFKLTKFIEASNLMKIHG